MSEQPAGVWRKSWKNRFGIPFWFLLAGGATAALVGPAIGFGLVTDTPVSLSNLLKFTAILSISVGLSAALASVFLRWLCCWRNCRRFLIGAGGFALLVALLFAEENWRANRAWKNFKREWEAKGERFDMAGVIPPPVPDDQNFALTPIVASCYSGKLDRNGHAIKPPNTNIVNRLEMSIYHENDWTSTNTVSSSWQKATLADLTPWQDYYRSNSAATNEFPTAPQPQSPAADVLLAMSRYAPAIEELRQASRLPYSRFPLNYGSDLPDAILLPHLAPMKYCINVLKLRIAAELQIGQTEAALADVKLAVRLIDSLRAEPFAISHLVRIAMWHITLNEIWEGLAEHRWSDAQLVEIQKLIAPLDFLKDYQFTMRGERGLNIGNVEYLRRHPGKLSEIYGFPDDENDHIGPTVSDMVGYFVPDIFCNQNELTLARMYQQCLLPFVDTKRSLAFPHLAKLTEKKMDAEFEQHISPYKFFAGIMLPPLNRSAIKFALAQSSVDLARTAIALERYRLANHVYPETLAALAPQFIDQVPQDVIGGQPLHYRRTDDGQFILYSIGWNETDDGGTVVFGINHNVVNTEKGDWVWRYPAP